MTARKEDRLSVHLAHPDYFQVGWWGTIAMCKRQGARRQTTKIVEVTCVQCLRAKVRRRGGSRSRANG